VRAAHRPLAHPPPPPHLCHWGDASSPTPPTSPRQSARRRRPLPPRPSPHPYPRLPPPPQVGRPMRRRRPNALSFRPPLYSPRARLIKRPPTASPRRRRTRVGPASVKLLRLHRRHASRPPENTRRWLNTRRMRRRSPHLPAASAADARGKGKGKQHAGQPPTTHTSPVPQFAVVQHAVPTGYALGDIHHWLEQDNQYLSIATTRWLLTQDRRAGKARSSMVLCLEDPTVKTSLR